MEIKGRVHCFFEQSGTFKNEFIKLGIPAEDYDIQNNFGETDHVIDLFGEIEKAYSGGVQGTIFQSISNNDLIMAFFPCIYFCEASALAMTYDHFNYRKLNVMQKTEKILERSKNREYFYELVIKLFAIVKDRGFRMVMENPYSSVHFLISGQNFVQSPTFIDKNRRLRGDFFAKPTAYWFVNCANTTEFTFQDDKKHKTIEGSKASPMGGLCSEERSMISPDYARNFICDFILGKAQPDICPTLFDYVAE